MNSEIQASEPNDRKAQALAPAPEKNLTLAAKKLAGSVRCLNRGTELKGPFCYYCGQPDKNFMRFFPALLRDLLDDLLDLDSRFMRTLKPLMLKPGRLTRDYMDGRRFRYTPPMRLYIFSSIAFFLLISLRVVYQQNWFLTIGKFIVIGVSYVALLILVTTGVAITSFVLL